MIIFLANQFVGNTISSGGDVLFTKIAEKIKNQSIILAPKIISQTLQKQFRNNIIIQTDKSTKFISASSIIGGIFTVHNYIKRAIYSTFWLSRNIKNTDTIYLTGDFICNTFPAWLIKIIRPQVNIVSNFYHRNPCPSERQGNNYFVSFASRTIQTISLMLMKCSSSTFFVLGKEGKSQLHKIGIPMSRIIISGAGIDKKIISKYSRNKKKSNRLIYIGRINVTKGAFDLISILKILDNQFSNWHCDFVGQGTDIDKKILLERAKEFGINNKITVHGFVDEDKKYRLLSQSSILLLPSKEEGFGIVILEALALQTKVICYNLPALVQLYIKYPDVRFIKLNNFILFSQAIIDMICEKTKKKTILSSLPDWEDVYSLQLPYIKK